MDAAFVIHGKIAEKQFVSDEAMPDVEGPAELIVYPRDTSHEEKTGISIFDLFGKAEHLRSAEDIDAQIREERAAWQKAMIFADSSMRDHLLKEGRKA
jgi:hypothetical protein